MTPDYKNKSQTAFAVAFIALVFVAETMQLTRGHPEPAAAVILAVLGVVGIGALVVGVVWHRRIPRAQ